MKRTLTTITPYAGKPQVRFGIIGLFGLSVAMATPIAMADVYVGTGKTVRHNVDGDVTQSESVIIAQRGTLIKTGEGKWTLPTSKLAQDWAASVKVGEGTLAVYRNAPERHSFTGVSNVLAEAASWFDASKSDSFVRDGSDNITDWLDVRENPSASPYVYTRAKTVTDIVSLYPVVQTVNGTTGLYFHGYKSGCYANLVTPSGSQDTKFCYNVFVVHGQLENLGTILGTRKSLAANYVAFAPGSSGGAFAPLWNFTAVGNMHNSRTYVNGSEVDGFTKTSQVMPAGFCLLESELFGTPGGVQCFFNDRDYWASSSVSGYQNYSWGGDRIGGEYLCEVLLFTTRLTDDERLAVEGYLMEKWFGVRHASSLSVEVASGAVAELSGSDESVPVEVSGTGSLVESGSGVKNIEYAESISVLANYRADGMTIVGYDLVPYLARAGESVSVGETTDGYVVASTAADGESLIKTGSGPLVIRGVPDGVKTLTVSEGTLTVRPAADVAEDSAVTEAMNLLSNGSFEEGRENFTYYQNLGNGVDFHDWHFTTSGSSMEAFVNHSSNNGGYNNSNPYIKIPTNTPDGECVLVLNKDATAQTSFTPTEAGDHEVSFYLSTRENSGSVNHILGVYVGQNGGEMTCLGAARALDYKGRFTVFRFIARNLSAGVTYALRFAPITSGVDRTSVIDNVKVCKIDSSRPFEIPNGGFEYFKADTAELVNPFEFSSANMTALEGWTLMDEQNFQGAVVSPVFQGTYKVSGTTSENSISWGGRYFCPQENGKGASQLFMGLGTKATATFTPPAGTYKIRANSALRIIGTATTRRADFICKVTIGGTEQSLGTFTITEDTLMRPRTFDTPFIVDGTEAVTLAFTSRRVGWNDVTSSGSGDHSAIGLIIDDVELVPVPAVVTGNLVQAPGFETGAMDVWGVQGGDWANAGYVDSVWGAQWYIGGGAHIDTDGASLLPEHLCASGTNVRYLRMHGSVTVTQQVAVATAGNYTLSVYGRKRTKSDGTIFESSAVKFWLAKGNKVLSAGEFVPTATNFCRHAWMIVIDEPGDWTLNVQNTSSGWVALDEFSLVRSADAADATGDWHEMVVNVAQGAKLDLDYVGTNKAYSVRLGNHRRTGIISAETYPDFVTGSGALEVTPIGTIMIFR